MTEHVGGRTREVARIEAVLAEHWRPEGYTVPSAQEYPHQWLWDSVFHAVLWTALDRPDRAIHEIANALATQGPDGFLHNGEDKRSVHDTGTGDPGWWPHHGGTRGPITGELTRGGPTHWRAIPPNRRVHIGVLIAPAPAGRTMLGGVETAELTNDQQAFIAFVAEVEHRLRRALIALAGPEKGA